MKNNQIVIADLNADIINEVSADELTSIQGGNPVAIALAVGGYIIANWADIKQGISDSLNNQ